MKIQDQRWEPMRGKLSWAHLSGVDTHLDNNVLNVAIMCTFPKFKTLQDSKKSSHLLYHSALYICNFGVIRKLCYQYWICLGIKLVFSQMPRCKEHQAMIGDRACLSLSGPQSLEKLLPNFDAPVANNSIFWLQWNYCVDTSKIEFISLKSFALLKFKIVKQ